MAVGDAIGGVSAANTAVTFQPAAGVVCIVTLHAANSTTSDDDIAILPPPPAYVAFLPDALCSPEPDMLDAINHILPPEPLLGEPAPFMVIFPSTIILSAD